MSERLVLLGYVAGAHGVRGALRVKLHNATSSTLEPGVALHLRTRGAGAKEGAGDGDAGEIKILSRFAPKPGSDMVRMWLEGVDSREGADALRGREVFVPRAALPEPEDDEYYLDDLVGLPVVREREGGEPESLGTITGLSSNGLQDLLVIRLRGAEWLLPALPVFIVAIEAQRVVVDVHDDMLPESR
ncbi:16S rRNA processing protein RimM [Pseudenhygromyxa sp. WMMC2535]|uniref:ribosome maturation factor RimM n=1 Tax=Pseudenhygromyxa sp. WMMC2535 TaxID=2712867 RepID=UPI001557F196|nr:ribosome maturation factor RimM [Pseudenhygromyxa sp. WMMC2535]NVB37849.1 16S rRNA processing protein RimM [Pseudenhygromyxa sp. WMMC2535]